jgi:ribose transport system substrate-binding protein
MDESKGVTSGAITALVVQNPFRIGFDLIIAMVQTARTDQITSSKDTGVTFVTQQHLNNPHVQAILKPTCENPPA